MEKDSIDENARCYRVYCYTNKANGKRYIGMTKRTDKKRWQHGHGYDHQYFGQAIQKYGINSFDVETLEDGLTREEAMAKETEYIMAYKTMDKEHGYNTVKGSGGGFIHHHHTGDARERISEKLKVRGFTDEHRKHISESKSGNKHHLAKEVYQYTKKGEFIRTWDYMSEATKVLGICKSHISGVCLGKRKTAGGYIWSYERM